MEYVDKIGWLYLKDRKLLSTLSRGKDIWYLPGGKREGGESDQETLIREVAEELSVDIIPDTIQFAGEFQAPAHSRDIDIKMRCYFADYNGELNPSAEVAKMDWLTYIDKSKSSAVDGLVFDWLKEKNLFD